MGGTDIFKLPDLKTVMHHKLNSIHLHCIGVKAEMLKTEIKNQQVFHLAADERKS